MSRPQNRIQAQFRRQGLLRVYEDICPGSAQAIIDMAKQDLDHQHKMDEKHQSGDFWLKVCGMAVVVAMLAMTLAGTIYLADHGHEKVAIAVATGMGFSVVAGVVGRIVQGRRRAAEETKPAPEKSKQIPKPPSKRRRK